MWENRGRGPHPPRLWDGGKTNDDPYAWKSKKQTPKLDDSMYIIRSQPRPGRPGWHRRTLRISMVLLENASLPRQNRDPRCFSSGLFFQLLCAPQLCSGLHTGPRPPRGSGLLMGAAPAAAASKFSGIPGRALGDYTAVIWD